MDIVPVTSLVLTGLLLLSLVWPMDSPDHGELARDTGVSKYQEALSDSDLLEYCQQFTFINAGDVRFLQNITLKLSQNLNGQLSKNNSVLSALPVLHMLATLQHGASPFLRSEIVRALPGVNRDFLRIWMPVISKTSICLKMTTEKYGGNFNFAKKLFVDQNANISLMFEEIMHWAGVQVGELDFSLHGTAAQREINRFVCSETAGMFPRVLSSPLPSDTTLVMANVLYFKSAWQSPFSVEHTQDIFFFSNRHNSKMVPTMFQVADFPAQMDRSGERGYRAILLPYKDQLTSMLIIVPTGEDGALDRFERSLTADKLNSLLSDLRVINVDLFLPKFSVSLSKSLVEPLKALGITSLFNRTKSPLSGMLSDRYAALDDIVFGNRIVVDEHGAEAASVLYTLSFRDAHFRRFYVNRPFLFMVLYRPLNIPLFYGRIDQL